MKFLPEVAAFLSVISLCTAASGTRVETDKGVQKEIYENSHTTNFLYANDLTGCTALAAHWPQEGTGTGAYKNALFVHVCQTTLNTDASLDKFMKDSTKTENGISISDWLDILTNKKKAQPEKTYFVVKVDSNGKEVFQANNQRFKSYINTHWGIQVSGSVPYKALKGDATAEQDPYANPAVKVTLDP
jgi:hypothetical protein